MWIGTHGLNRTGDPSLLKFSNEYELAWLAPRPSGYVGAGGLEGTAAAGAARGGAPPPGGGSGGAGPAAPPAGGGRARRAPTPARPTRGAGAHNPRHPGPPHT